MGYSHTLGTTLEGRAAVAKLIQEHDLHINSVSRHVRKQAAQHYYSVFF
jgi:hypothetical protein